LESVLGTLQRVEVRLSPPAVAARQLATEAEVRVYRDCVTDADWSPADHPHAVALSEANAWKRAIDLCADRMRAGSPDDQTDARLFLLALRLLLRAQRMASDAVKALPVAAQIADNARR
jgi:hypothetical protein